jgi:hypothetical protein
MKYEILNKFLIVPFHWTHYFFRSWYSFSSLINPVTNMQPKGLEPCSKHRKRDHIKKSLFNPKPHTLFFTTCFNIILQFLHRYLRWSMLIISFFFPYFVQKVSSKIEDICNISYHANFFVWIESCLSLPKVEYHRLSAFCNSLLNVFAASLYIWKISFSSAVSGGAIHGC